MCPTRKEPKTSALPNLSPCCADLTLRYGLDWLYFFIASGSQLISAERSKLFCSLCYLSAFNFWNSLQADSSAWISAEHTLCPSAHPEHLDQTNLKFAQHIQCDSRCFVVTIRSDAFAADAHSQRVSKLKASADDP